MVVSNTASRILQFQYQKNLGLLSKISISSRFVLDLSPCQHTSNFFATKKKKKKKEQKGTAGCIYHTNLITSIISPYANNDTVLCGSTFKRTGKFTKKERFITGTFNALAQKQPRRLCINIKTRYRNTDDFLHCNKIIMSKSFNESSKRLCSLFRQKHLFEIFKAPIQGWLFHLGTQAIAYKDPQVEERTR